MGYQVLSETGDDRYPMACADEVAERMAALLRERGAAPLLVLARAETREEAIALMRMVAAGRRKRRRGEREGKSV